MLIGATANQTEPDGLELPEERERLLTDGSAPKGHPITDYGTMQQANMSFSPDQLRDSRSNGRWVRLEVHKSISSDELIITKADEKLRQEDTLADADQQQELITESSPVSKSKKRRRDSYPTATTLSKSLVNEGTVLDSVTYQLANVEEIAVDAPTTNDFTERPKMEPLEPKNRTSVQFVEMAETQNSCETFREGRTIKPIKKTRWYLARNSSTSWRSSWTNSSAGSFVEERGDEAALLSKGSKSGGNRSSSDRLLTWTSYIFSPSWLQNWRRKRSREERRARKAFRTITVIVGAFALFWSPFYLLATIYGFCASCIPPFLFTTSYYMCYLNVS